MDNPYNLKGKTAWITGGKRIGQRVAEVLAQHGASLILSYRNSNKEAEDTLKKIKKLGVMGMKVQADVSSAKSVANAANEIKKRFKKIDILVLMASVFKPVKIDSITEEDLRKNFDAHIMGTFLPVQASLSLMPPGSHIITISDRTAIGRMYVGCLPYIITKGAVASMTKALAVELAPKGIFVNCIAPGPVLKAEKMSHGYWSEIRKNSIINYPISDKEAVEEFAKLVLYLSTARSSGSIYPLDFGWL